MNKKRKIEEAKMLAHLNNPSSSNSLYKLFNNILLQIKNKRKLKIECW